MIRGSLLLSILYAVLNEQGALKANKHLKTEIGPLFDNR